MAYEDLDAGDETRRNGDELGFPHQETDGTALDNLTGPDRGRPLTYNASAQQIEQAAEGDTVIGVLKSYDVYGDTGQEKVSDNDATVGTGGTFVCDFSGITFNGGTGVDVDTDEGSAFGANGELLITEIIDASNDLAEVRVR